MKQLLLVLCLSAATAWAISPVYVGPATPVDYPLDVANGGTGVATSYEAFDALSTHGADIASSSTVNLGASTGDLVDVTGTTTITAITLANGKERTVRFTGALTLTHGASLVLPGAANITTAAGDFAVFRGYASSVVRCVLYSYKSGVRPGANDGSDYAAGAIGERKRALVAVGSAVSFVTNTAKTVASISLSAGDWDVEATLNFTTGTATFSGLQAGISDTTNTLPTDGTEAYSGVIGTTLSTLDSITLPAKAYNVSTTTPIYLVGKVTFSTGTAAGFGQITATRVR